MVRRAAEQRLVIPLLSKPVLDEYRVVLLDEEISRRLPDITPDLVEITIHRLRFIGDYVRSPRKHFQYERDPQDAKFIELAIALDATHIVSADKDLLSLPISRTDAGERFRQRLPNVEVLEAADFMRKYASSLKAD